MIIINNFVTVLLQTSAQPVCKCDKQQANKSEMWRLRLTEKNFDKSLTLQGQPGI